MKFRKEDLASRQSLINDTGKRLFHKFCTTVCMLFILTLICVTVFGGSFAYGAFETLIRQSQDISYEDVAPTDYYTLLYDSDGKPIEKLVKAGANREEVSISQIPDNLINAFIAIEDERFWIHNGIDIRGIIRAGFTAVTTMRATQGASTITQQLIKNSIFNGGLEKSLGAKIERKVKEQALAISLEKKLSKNVILENYLNTINLGNNCLGVQAAANRYFGKDVSELTLSECAVIAATTQNPSGYNPIRFPENNQKRQQTTLRYMKEQGLISQQEYDEAIADDVYSRIQITSSTEKNHIFSYFTDSVIDSVVDDLQNELGYTQTQAYNMLYSGGLSIYTTMDSDIQDIVDKEVNDPDNYPFESYSISYRLKIIKLDNSIVNYSENDIKTFIQTRCGKPDFIGLFDTKEEIAKYIEAFKLITLEKDDIIDSEEMIITLQPQCSMVIMDPSTGYVRAISGGRGEKTTNLSFNRATQSKRQPGSTFKPLSTFAPALDTCGATLASVYYDSPLSADGQNFSNWWGDEYLGYVNIRDAIAYSMNLITLHCLFDTVSVDLAYDYVQKFGISTLVDSRKNADGTVVTDRIASLALGGLTDGVTNLELTAAYSTIANQGVYKEPIFYTKILNHDGSVLLEKRQKSSNVISADTASLLTSAMESTFGTNLSSDYTEINPNILPTGEGHGFSGMSLAAKSGSTTDNNDVWFVGYSPYYCCGIWSGYDKSKALQYGQTYHKDIWKRVMEQIHEDLPDIGWPQNPNIVSAKICSKCGLLAVDGLCDAEEANGSVYTEYFVKGTEPTQTCTCHEKITLCKESNLPCNNYCPANDRIDHVYFKLNPSLLHTDYTTDDMNYTLPEYIQKGICTIHKAPVPETTTAPETTTEEETKEKESKKSDHNKDDSENKNEETKETESEKTD